MKSYLITFSVTVNYMGRIALGGICMAVVTSGEWLAATMGSSSLPRMSLGSRQYADRCAD